MLQSYQKYLGGKIPLYMDNFFQNGKKIIYLSLWKILIYLKK